jgi:hypothetical protein
MSDTGDAGTAASDGDDQGSTAVEEGQGPDLKAEVEHWKAMSRRNENQAKANLRELEKVRTSGLSEAEQAVAQAKAEARAEAAREYGAELVEAHMLVAAKGTGLKVDVLLEGLDVGKFLGDDGKVDRKAIDRYVARLVPKGRGDDTEDEGDGEAPQRRRQEPGEDMMGQGAGRGAGALPLNGDPLQRAVERKLGIR